MFVHRYVELSIQLFQIHLQEERRRESERTSERDGHREGERNEITCFILRSPFNEVYPSIHTAAKTYMHIFRVQVFVRWGLKQSV